MTLSCSCGYDDYGDAAWTYIPPEDFSMLATNRAKRCCSCKALIKPGETVLKFDRFRYPNTDIEEKIYGEGGEVPLADWYMCEECGDLYYSLDALGFCISLGEDNMKKVVKDYARFWKK
jgi:hypothetical protein